MSDLPFEPSWAAPVELQDFRNFMHVVWEEAFKRTPEPMQYDIASWLQHLPLCDDGVRRGQVRSLRGEGKTEIEATLAAFFLWLNPDLKGLVICSTAPKAADFMRHVRNIIQFCDFLNHLLPKRGEGRSKDQRDSGLGFEVGNITVASKDPSLGCFGVKSTWTSVHPDFIIADDVETRENALTVGRRESLRKDLVEMEALKKPGGYVLITGTPQTEDTVYDKFPAYKVRKWPARHVEPTSLEAKDVSPWLLDQVISGEAKVGDPTSPDRFDHQVLRQIEDTDPSYYQLQMMLNTRASDEERHPLKIRDLIVMDQAVDMAPEKVVWDTQKVLPIDPAGFDGDVFHPPGWTADLWLPYQASLMWIDPSGSGADKVAWAILKFLNGMFFLQDVGGLAGGSQGSSDAVMVKLAQHAADFQVKRVIVEDNFGDGMYRQLLTPHLYEATGGITVEGRKVTGQKELRIIDCLLPLTRNHRLIISPRVAKNQDFIYQFSHITRDRGSLAHEDELDAVAGACSVFAEAAAIDPARQQKRREDEEVQQELRSMAASFRSQERQRQPRGLRRPRRDLRRLR